MGLIQYAKQELELAGLYDKDSDYNGMLAIAVMELIEVFAKQGHSGFSAMRVLELFSKLAQFKNLMPLTFKQDEWMIVSDMCSNGKSLWQNKRDTAIFSDDEGKTYYSVDDPRRERNQIQAESNDM